MPGHEEVKGAGAGRAAAAAAGGAAAAAGGAAAALSGANKQHPPPIASSEEEGEEGGADSNSSSPVRPVSIKRTRTEDALAGLDISAVMGGAHASATAAGAGAGSPTSFLPPPPDCPPYLQASQMPVWVGRAPPMELTAERVDELHHVQWRVWKEGRDGAKDYARILEVAPALFHAGFAKMNPHNAAITVGITVDAMHATGAPPLACATTFLYGLSLLADNPVRLSLMGRMAGTFAFNSFH